jgi:hypothetical protein
VIDRLAQITRHRERAPFSILRRAGIEPDLAAGEVHPSPLERQSLAVDSPARDVCEGRDGAHRLRQSLKHRQKLLALEDT